VTVVLAAVGVFAVSYLNVKERTGEIGLRMAVGATRVSVAVLFVFESLMLSAAGGVIGVAFGAALAAALKAATVWPLAVDFRGFLLPFAVAAGIGVLCSLVPAWRAARVMPAVALAG
jgi:ABC-type antimicrobial peptide transport system permease subunit